MAEKKSPPWTAKELALLGTMPDPKLARRLGRTRSAVQLKRHRRGIRMFHYIPRWKPEEIALLGKVSDEEVARQTGRFVVAIKAKRLKATNVRFPTHTPTWPLRRWTEADKAVLREGNNREVMARFCCSKETVQQARKAFHIPSPRRVRTWTPEADALLGTMPDAKLAVRLHCGALAVEQRREALGRIECRRGSAKSEVLTARQASGPVVLWFGAVGVVLVVQDQSPPRPSPSRRRGGPAVGNIGIGAAVGEMAANPGPSARCGWPPAVSRIAGLCPGLPSSGACSAVERQGPPALGMALLGHDAG